MPVLIAEDVERGWLLMGDAGTRIVEFKTHVDSGFLDSLSRIGKIHAAFAHRIRPLGKKSMEAPGGIDLVHEGEEVFGHSVDPVEEHERPGSMTTGGRSRCPRRLIRLFYQASWGDITRLLRTTCGRIA